MMPRCCHLFSCGCSNVQPEQLNALKIKLTAIYNSTENQDINIVFIGSGGLYHEFNLIQNLLSHKKENRRLTITAIDPLYFNLGYSAEQGQLALSDFITRIKKLDKSVNISAHSDLSFIWPIKSNTKYILVAIDPVASIKKLESGEIVEIGAVSEMFRTQTKLRELGVTYEAFIINDQTLMTTDEVWQKTRESEASVLCTSKYNTEYSMQKTAPNKTITFYKPIVTPHGDSKSIYENRIGFSIRRKMLAATLTSS